MLSLSLRFDLERVLAYYLTRLYYLTAFLRYSKKFSSRIRRGPGDYESYESCDPLSYVLSASSLVEATGSWVSRA